MTSVDFKHAPPAPTHHQPPTLYDGGWALYCGLALYGGGEAPITNPPTRHREGWPVYGGGHVGWGLGPYIRRGLAPIRRGLAPLRRGLTPIHGGVGPYMGGVGPTHVRRHGTTRNDFPVGLTPLPSRTKYIQEPKQKNSRGRAPK
jgi:hypothetical protein